MSITLSETTSILQASEEKATEMGVPVTIVVVDGGGHIKGLHRMDRAAWFTVDVATAMAFTVTTFGRPGEDLIPLQDRPFFQTFSHMQGGKVLAALGSMPIKRGEDMIGGIGVSGGSGEQDLEIVKAGLSAFA